LTIVLLFKFLTGVKLQFFQGGEKEKAYPLHWGKLAQQFDYASVLARKTIKS
jgi:hypothetical protein